MPGVDFAEYLTLDADGREAWKLTRIQQVRALLAPMPTAQIAHVLLHTQRADVAAWFTQQAGWTAPYRARHYFASLAMQTPAPSRITDVTANVWIAAARIVEELMQAHGIDTTAAENAPLITNLHQHRRWNPRFIDVEQIRARCLHLFDSIGSNETGIACTSTDAVAIIERMLTIVEDNLNRLTSSSNDPLGTWEALSLHRTDLDTAGLAFVDSLALRRGERDDQLRFADTDNGSCLTEERPLFIERDRIFVPDANALWRAVYGRLLHSSRKNAYNEKRKEYVEGYVAQLFSDLFGEKNAFRGVWEKKGGPEHDLLVLASDAMIAVEAKAATALPPVSLDHEHTFQRTHKHVGEDASVFKAIRQAQGLLRHLVKAGGAATLRVGPNDNDAVPERFDVASRPRRYAIAVSLEDYGFLTTDWGTLDAVDRDLGKPWAVALHTLEQFIWGLQRRGWNGDDLLVYLDDRAASHGTLRTFDELDYAGYWLVNGNLATLKSGAVTYSGANYAAIFDELWLERRGVGTVSFPEVPRPNERPPIDREAARRRFVDDLVDRMMGGL